MTSSSTYELAAYVHGAFFGHNEVLTDEERYDSNIRADLSEGCKTERLTAMGEIEGRRAYQHLSRATNGIYYVSTVFTEPNGGRARLNKVTPNSPLHTIDVVAETLFVKVLLRILETRSLD